MNGILELLAPVIRMAVHNVLKNLLSEFVVKNPTHAKVVLASLYPAVDAELEPLVDTTPTELDNAAIAAIKQAIEEVAVENGVQLSNVDAD